MHIKLRRHAPVNGVEEVTKLRAPMPPVQLLVHLADHGSGLDIERGEEVRRAVPDVVMRLRVQPISTSQSVSLKLTVTA